MPGLCFLGSILLNLSQNASIFDSRESLVPGGCDQCHDSFLISCLAISNVKVIFFPHIWSTFFPFESGNALWDTRTSFAKINKTYEYEMV